jgi:hypothetical protein
MADLRKIIEHLHAERAKIDGAIEALQVLGDGHDVPTPTRTLTVVTKKPKRKLSAAGRAAIRAAVKARWAAKKKAEKTEQPKPKAKKPKVMSAAARAAISKKMKAAWAARRKKAEKVPF